MTANEQAARVKLSIEEGRPSGATEWHLSEWEHPLIAGVFPLAVRTEERLIALGTAFCISSLGVVASAYHVLHEALRFHPAGDRLRATRWVDESADLAPLSFDVLHRHEKRFTVAPLRTIQGAKPTDIVLAHGQFGGSAPFIPMPISFSVPRIGSRVLAIGYGGLRTGDDGISIERLAAGDASELEHAGLALTVVEGRVTRIFTKRFADGYIEGPCFEFGADVPHGTSGGPVINEDGFVCGVVAAGAGIYAETGAATIVSMLYPLILQDVQLESVVGSAAIRTDRALADLIGMGVIQTDGSETRLPIVQTPNGPLAGINTHRDDIDFVFDDLRGALDGVRAEKIVGEAYQIRFQR